jgi:hypothetical protein
VVSACGNAAHATGSFIAERREWTLQGAQLRMNLQVLGSAFLREQLRGVENTKDH